MFSADDVSVVIPTRRRWPILQRTLEALEAQTARGFEVVVVVDGTDQQVPSALPGSPHVVQQTHGGPGAARNRGVAAISRPLVLFIGDDMIPRPRFLERHVARHRAEPADAYAVLGRIVWHPEVPRDRLHRWLEWSTALFDYEQLEREPDREAGWPRFYSSNVSMKRALFEATGGFDPDFTFDYEDLDFGYRLGQSGMRLFYDREATVDHLHPYDWEAVVRRYESRAAAERLMMSKHEWFKPWFRNQIARARAEPGVSRAWALAVDWLPASPRRVRVAFERRANRWYLQRLAPAFDAAWRAADPPNAAEPGQ